MKNNFFEKMNNINRFTPPYPLKTAVLFLVYNRPDTTKRVFGAIRQAKPPRLYVAADGPKKDKPGDENKVKAVRDYIMQNIDWDCEVKTLFRDKNLGCKYAVSSAITWFFENEEMGIILEDDTLPHPTFFRFCEELLKRYRNDKRIMAISGDNFQFGRRRTQYSYYFSRYPHCWGWASWRRAWKYYDVNIKLWPEIRDGRWLKDILGNKKSVINYWKNIFNKVYQGEIDTWDYQWLFACWIQNGLSILPNVNLVSNIGFRMEATHTKGSSRFSNMKTEPMNFPLIHPPFIVRDDEADSYTEKYHFNIRPFSQKVLNKLIRSVEKFMQHLTKEI